LEILPEVIKYWTKLQIFYTNDNSLKTIPNWIGELTAITNLSFSNNNLTTIPSSISNLTKVNDLSLNNNKIISLPAEIGNMSNFGTINLKNNNLNSLPPSIQKIRSIYIFKNSIPLENLLDYKEWKKENPNFFNNDFDSEIQRIREEKRKPISNDAQSEIIKEPELILKNQQSKQTYEKDIKQKSGCLGQIALFLIIVFVALTTF
ncbi:MAG: leucine-rich repeat domain-containing protein, partial [Psychroflexus sp.]